MKFLSEIELQERGNRCGLVAKDANGSPKYIACVFVDRDPRYFIATAMSLSTGTAINRHRWRQVQDVATNEHPERLLIEIPQPVAAEVYYSCCAKVDNHNRDRCDTLQLERKFEMNNWSMRVNMTIFGMIVVDCWKVYSKLVFEIDEEGNKIARETQKQCYGRLAAELIDNNQSIIIRRLHVVDEVATMPAAIDMATGRPTSGVGSRLTPTKKKRRKADGTLSNYCWQGYCCVCHSKTTYVCSVCNENPCVDGEVFVCSTRKTNSQKLCFHEHLTTAHHTEDV
jgi:hypothetical protein